MCTVLSIWNFPEERTWFLSTGMYSLGEVKTSDNILNQKSTPREHGLISDERSKCALMDSFSPRRICVIREPYRPGQPFLPVIPGPLPALILPRVTCHISSNI